MKIAGFWKHINSFRLLDLYKVKARIAANKPDGDLLDSTSLEQNFAPFRMTSDMLVGGTFLVLQLLCPRWMVTEILEH